jgi:preprotein translocase subunit SecD
MKNIRWRSILILTVLVASCAVGVYPIVAAQYGITTPKLLMEKQLKLGLDLKGGVHLVLRVERDDALKVETDTTVERLRDTLSRANVQSTKIEARSNDEFVVEGVTNDQAFRQAAAEADAVFTRSSGTGTYTFTMRPNIANQLREESVIQALLTIERRVNELGVTEPVVARQGAADQILVQLPGVTDVTRAKQIIGSTATLELKLVEQGPFASQDLAMQAVNNNLPPDMTIISGTEDIASTGGGTPGTVYYIVKKAAPITGRDLRNAQPTLDENNLPAVSFTLTQDGATRFGTFTEQNIGRQLAIILDNRVFSAPNIQSRITDQGRITGSFTQEEAQDLSLILRTGALPARLTYLEERTIGPSLGADSIRSGVIASVVGLILIVLFMIAYYRLSGINAVVALIFNLVILLGLMAYIGAVMTLPGIAGFVLTMGIGVDSNVLIFERIKEELDAQRGVRAAINSGFSRVFLTLLDTHIATLISAAFLFQFGTGAIRGFAVTLFIGLISNLFTSIFVSKTLFEAALSNRHQVATLSI